MSGANVLVSGVQREMGGLKQAHATFRKHHIEVGDALMNISGVGTATGAAVDKDDPRPAYVHQEWPKMIYHADGREVVVGDATEMKEYQAKGFRIDPYPRPQVAVLDPATEKKALLDQRDQLQAQLAKQAEVMDKMAARLQALENNQKKG